MDGQAQAIADTRRNTVSEKTTDKDKSSAPQNKEVPQDVEKIKDTLYSKACKRVMAADGL